MAQIDEFSYGGCSGNLLTSLFLFQNMSPFPGGVTWVNFCWVCAPGLSEPLPHYSLFYGQL